MLSEEVLPIVDSLEMCTGELVLTSEDETRRDVNVELMLLSFEDETSESKLELCSVESEEDPAVEVSLIEDTAELVVLSEVKDELVGPSAADWLMLLSVEVVAVDK